MKTLIMNKEKVVELSKPYTWNSFIALEIYDVEKKIVQAFNGINLV
jgi:hypothetical protein